MPPQTNKKAMLVILDGWGIRRSKRSNAIANARKPNFDRLWKQNPHTALHASGEYVGLPAGVMGNSEVGHIHLGGGRISDQELVRINKSIKDGSFFKNRVLLDAMQYVKKKDSSLHLLGLLSDGAVHSHISHLLALLKMAKQNRLKKVHVHCFLDGRDTAQRSAKKYLNQLISFMKKNRIGKISTVIGRFYAMDRDNRWNREHKAYDAMVNGTGMVAKDAISAVTQAYSRGETDEFVSPTVILDDGKKNLVQGNDAIIFYNFRSDRAREITRAFVQGKFNKFKRKKLLNLRFVCLVQYDKKIKTPVAFPPKMPLDILGEVVSDAGLMQFRTAETEKYAHVTYFFNCGSEQPFRNEERFLVPSPKVRTYDMKPEMSANKVTEVLLKRINTGRYSLIVVNYANPDMVGHTGDYKATIKAVEAADGCLGRVVSTARSKGYDVLITADHGNAEEMCGKRKTTHTTNKVPFILVSQKKYKLKTDKDSCTANIAPTILKLLGLKKPKEMIKELI
ncbi:MAG: 2,3-bisphosphoglycerate-independent phosphoglycerate mutase [Nanoarchaeota archaeon]|nr:2,3-bisphosphoglycerate-independent phosphoglycerate mutase [Nanoarchaeota archaeon]